MKKRSLPHYIIVSTEDDKYLVKGGIGTYLGLLAEALPRQNVSVDWVTQSPSDISFVEHDPGVTRHYLGLDKQQPYSTLLTKLGYKVEELASRYAAHDRQVIVEAPDWEGPCADFYSSHRRENITKVCRLHTPLAVTAELNQAIATPNVFQQVNFERIEVEHADIISSPTKFVLKRVEEVFSLSSNQQVYVIPNLINIPHFKPSEISRSESCRLVTSATGEECSPNNYNIFFIGSVEYRKGVRLACDFINEWFPDHPKANAYFIGHHASQDDSDSTLNENPKLRPSDFWGLIEQPIQNRVHLCGYVPHALLPNIYNAGDAFPILYLADNFPGTVCELGLAEKPMVCLLRGGIPEIINDGTRFLTPTVDGPDDASIVSSLVKLFNSDQLKDSRMQNQLATHLRSTYDMDKLVGRYLQSYQVNKPCL